MTEACMKREYKLKHGTDNITVLVVTEKAETPIGHVMTGTGKEWRNIRDIIRDDMVNQALPHLRWEAQVDASLLTEKLMP